MRQCPPSALFSPGTVIIAHTIGGTTATTMAGATGTTTTVIITAAATNSSAFISNHKP